MRQLPACYYRTPIGLDLLRWLTADEFVVRNGCGDVIGRYVRRFATMQVAPS